ncbi:MAG TPA: enoyl-ACP reductase FabI [Rickettsia endosymbiont of Pyrocoelia pectoralis]|nr:enoyl-ACP reductase FabI [Rickettsia endosymbiont of Pyrocoelia pectoralis]
MTTGLLQGKKGLITGVANNMSISWAIAQLAHKHGAELAFTYQSEALERRVRPLAEEVGCNFVSELDVTNPESITNLFAEIKEKWGSFDFMLHGMAFSDRNELKGRYIDTSLANFGNSLHISCYSLVELAKHAEPLMNEGGSIITLSYYGAEKVIPNYNVMGVAKAALEASVRYLANDMGENNIRVNAISAGPIKTLSGSVIGDFNSMLKSHATTAPLKRNTTQQDVAGAAVYLFSELSAGVSGEVHYVDCGYNVMGSNKIVS